MKEPFLIQFAIPRSEPTNFDKLEMKYNNDLEYNEFINKKTTTLITDTSTAVKTEPSDFDENLNLAFFKAKTLTEVKVEMPDEKTMNYFTTLMATQTFTKVKLESSDEDF